MRNNTTPTTVLGLGAMGSALAAALIDAGHPTTVWNRSPARARPLVARGATAAGSAESAVSASPLIVACLFDHASVHEVLGPTAGSLRGRTLVNLTTTTPNQARELAAWSASHGIDYLDGGIMAVPEMIGGPGSAILYSGSQTAFDAHRALLDLWGKSTYFGSDAGMASLYDLAMLAGMYAMFAGFLHGAAMVGSEGVSATEFAARATPFLAAMTGAFAGFAATIDAKDYAGEGQQSLEFSDLTKLVAASTEQGVSAEVLQPVHEMIRRQIAAGHGKEGFARIFEELRSTR
ncbi:NAD(P)-dependent oxidoreductase [Sorangium sp. So ce341]|uniref:NAD(P)-dependent oxidoreductase n=1 Tax=Sorangium sp. So ce341 TaxID=3133302 RepID=UPI003F62BD18